MTEHQSTDVRRPYEPSTAAATATAPSGKAVTPADKTAPKSIGRAMTAAFAVTAVLIVGELSLIHVGRADVAIAVSASELAFTLDSTAVLTRAIEIDSARLFGLQGIRVPDYGGQAEALVKTTDVGVSRNNQTSRITLGALRGEHGSEIGVDAPAQHGRSVTLRATGITSSPTFATVSPVVLSTSSGRDTLRGPGVRVLTVVRPTTDLQMKVDLVDTASSLFTGSLPIRTINLHRLSRDGTTDLQSGRREESVLRSIRVRFDGYESDSTENPSAIVRLTIARSGVARGLRVSSRGVEATITATASDLTFDGRSAMPTWLDFFSKQVHVRPFYIVVTFVIGALAALYHWWSGTLHDDPT